jgi:hypothetical protein
MASHDACCGLGVDCVHRAGVYARTAVDAGICSDSPLVTSFGNGVHRAGILAGSAVNALISNGMTDFVSGKLAHRDGKVYHKGVNLRAGWRQVRQNRYTIEKS